MSEKRETNEELIIRMMNFSPTGALSQAFIIEAISRYADQVASAESVPDSPFLSGKAWKHTGEWIKSQVDSHLSR